MSEGIEVAIVLVSIGIMIFLIVIAFAISNHVDAIDELKHEEYERKKD